ncbi:MAG TPA: hypothetical protein VG326_02375 [Tepidisphaeraceae bacterium]|jgi:hypothetical protein|nr:hypothetical protein [Tepidisphaeraceae bacterium]
MPIFFAAMMFAIVVVVAVVVVYVWVIMLLFRGVSRLFCGSAKSPAGANGAADDQRVRQCSRAECFTNNPAHAQFCRKCGRRLKTERVRRVA